jgi:hypothetical protein
MYDGWLESLTYTTRQIHASRKVAGVPTNTEQGCTPFANSITMAEALLATRREIRGQTH